MQKISLVLLLLAFLLIFATCSAQTDSKGTVEPELRSETQGSKTDEAPTDEIAEKVKEALSAKGEKIQFQAEINQLLGIIINSLYTNKDIFLRELISNASDALDKLRFMSLTDKKILDTNEKMEIRIQAFPEKNTIVIHDTGIGMTKKDLIQNLGTIAKSGTKAFLEKIKQSKESANLIGQFGVGFYSAFLVADTVTVASKHNDDIQYIWQSTADNSFVVVEDPRGNTLGRGTEITLHLKDDADAKELLNDSKLKELIRTYSEFIHFPIYLYTTKNVTTEVPVEEPKPEEKAEEKTEEKTENKAEEKKDEEEKIDIEDVKDEKKTEEKPKTKTVTEVKNEWEFMNENKPIWTRAAKDVPKEDYVSFYKAITKDTEEPTTWIHFTGEGQVEFKAILFVPSRPPFNLFDVQDKRNNIKLYVKRVFITDSIADIMPKYLSFIRGIVDSDDLPLNVSREILQHSKLLKLIKAKLVHKAISMIKILAEKEEKARKSRSEAASEEEKKQNMEDSHKYSKFWKEFGKTIKLGVIEDSENRNRLAKLVRFYSTKSEFEYTSFDDYITRMKDKQKSIFYVAGETIEDVRKSPFLEEARKRDIEVLYLTDPIDEYMVQHLKEYEGKEIQSVAREDVKFTEETDDEKKKAEDLKKEFEPLTQFFKDSLGQKIIRADIGKRFSGQDQSPCVVSSTQYGYTANMYRIMKAQTLGNDQLQMLNMYANAKILELNPAHPVIKELNNRVKQDKNDGLAKSMAQLLYETALLRSGYPVEDSATFADHIFDIMKEGLHVGTYSAPKAEAKEAKDEL